MTDPVPARGLSPDDAAALARLLSAERDATSTRIEELTREFDSIVESAALEPPDHEHDPEGSTIGFERAQVAALNDQARSRLGELERARRRLGDGTYGACEHCGHPIGLERLQARPGTQTCIRCAAGPRRAVRPR